MRRSWCALLSFVEPGVVHVEIDILHRPERELRGIASRVGAPIVAACNGRRRVKQWIGVPRSREDCACRRVPIFPVVGTVQLEGIQVVRRGGCALRQEGSAIRFLVNVGSVRVEKVSAKGPLKLKVEGGIHISVFRAGAAPGKEFK